MSRRVLIVADAAGPSDAASAVLNRFGFTGAPARAASIDAAMEQADQERFDLVILPLEDIDALQLASLERQIRRGAFGFVIGTAPRAEPELILRAMRSGIHEFLVYPPEPKDLSASVDRLMRRNHSERRRGQVVATYSSKGGLGNSTIAVNIAYGFAKAFPDVRVALADLVVTGGDVRVLLNLRPAYDMGDLVEKLDRVDADLMYSLLTPLPGGVWALPGPDKPESDELLDAATITTIVQQLQTHFAFTVLDCEHHLSERTLAAMDIADRVVLVTQLNVPSLRGTQRTLSLCRRLGYSEDKLCVVVNRHQPTDVLSVADAEDVLQTSVFWKLPNEYKLTTAALVKGVPVSDVDGSSKLATSFTQLCARLAGTAETLASRAVARRNGSRLRTLFSMKKRT